MKKYLIIIAAMIIVPFSTFAQSYTTTFSSWGNTIDSRTTNSYGMTVGTSSSWIDSFGNVSTTYSDAYGNRIGSSSSSIDSFGNFSTTYTDASGNRHGSSESYSTPWGEIETTTNDAYGRTLSRSSTTNKYPWVRLKPPQETHTAEPLVPPRSGRGKRILRTQVILKKITNSITCAWLDWDSVPGLAWLEKKRKKRCYVLEKEYFCI